MTPFILMICLASSHYMHYQLNGVCHSAVRTGCAASMVNTVGFSFVPNLYETLQAGQRLVRPCHRYPRSKTG